MKGDMQQHGQKSSSRDGSGRLLRKGSRGDEVRELQGKLQRLGFDLKSDGIFGDDTERAVIQLQTMFGYTVDAIVGEGTAGLIDAQIGYGWNVKAPNAAEMALRAQGKGAPPATKPTQAQSTGPQPAGVTPSGSGQQWSPTTPLGKPSAQAAPTKPAPTSKPAPQGKSGGQEKPSSGLPKAPWPWNR